MKRDTTRQEPQVEFLCLLGQRLERSVALDQAHFAVGHQVAEHDAAMRAHPLVRKFAALDQPDQIRPRDTEEIRRLSRRQTRMDRHPAHRVALGDVGEDVDPHAQRRDRHLDLAVDQARPRKRAVGPRPMHAASRRRLVRASSVSAGEAGGVIRCSSRRTVMAPISGGRVCADGNGIAYPESIAIIETNEMRSGI